MSKKLPYEGTSVSVSKSQGKIRDLLRDYGIGDIATIERTDGSAEVRFQQAGIPVRIPFSFKKLFERKKDIHPQTAKEKLLEQTSRELWRHAYYYLKAVFDILDTGIISFEQAFFPYLTDGQRTLFESVRPSLPEWYARGTIDVEPRLPPYQQNDVKEGEEQ